MLATLVLEITKLKSLRSNFNAPNIHVFLLCKIQITTEHLVLRVK